MGRGLIHHRRRYLPVVLGTAVSTAVLVGALMARDSVRYSLRRLTDLRLGSVEYAVHTGDRFFTVNLGVSLKLKTERPVASLIVTEGITVAENVRINGVKVIGVDQSFSDLSPTGAALIPHKQDQVIINVKLSERLGVHVGDEILLRIRKPDIMPGEAPLSGEADPTAAVRAIVGGIAAAEQYGNFSLNTSQVLPFNVFLHNELLAKLLAIPGKANTLLVGSGDSTIDIASLQETIATIWELEDAGLLLSRKSGVTELTSNRIFIESSVALPALKAGGQGILTYFVDEIRIADRSIPYSFVSAPGSMFVPSDLSDDEIALNRWAAADLGAVVGDTVVLRFRIPGDASENSGGLIEKERAFKLRIIVPIHDEDLFFMPQFPGLHNVDNCRDWKPGAPIDVALIRDQDEAYWDRYRGSPKAFVTLASAQEMWANRFGGLTAIRFTEEPAAVSHTLLAEMSPSSFGMTLLPVRERGIRASEGGVDFGQLFLGLSMFLLFSSLLLTALLLSMALRQRSEEAGTLLALGYPRGLVNYVFLGEGVLIALIGALGGVFIGILYNRLIVWGLSTVWQGAVRTSALYQVTRTSTIVQGGLLGWAVSLLTLWITLRRIVYRPITEIQRSTVPSFRKTAGFRRKCVLFGAGLGMLTALILVITGIVTESNSTVVFFGAGSLLLLSGLVVFWIMHDVDIGERRRQRRRLGQMSTEGLGLLNTARRRTRSMAVASLLACGVFIVTAVGANRHTIRKSWGERESGTGGFVFWAETSVPVYEDLNSESGRKVYRIESVESVSLRFIGLRVKAGDDASCLNLNRVENPAILGVDHESLTGAFSFRTVLDGYDPKFGWEILGIDLENGIIPAVADQTVITWGLGKEVGDDLLYVDEHGRELKLRLVAGLANSVFQGSVIISEDAFIDHFPSEGGKRLFLIEAEKEDPRPEVIQEHERRLLRGMADTGIELQSTHERLAAFYSVENTYLSIFLILGGFGLLLGSAGVGITVMRNVIESRSENALLRAIGYPESAILKIMFTEHLPAILFGIIWGAIAARIAVFPVLSGGPLMEGNGWLYALLGLLTLLSIVWVVMAVRFSVRGNFLPALREE